MAGAASQRTLRELSLTRVYISETLSTVINNFAENNGSFIGTNVIQLHFKRCHLLVLLALQHLFHPTSVIPPVLGTWGRKVYLMFNYTSRAAFSTYFSHFNTYSFLLLLFLICRKLGAERDN